MNYYFIVIESTLDPSKNLAVTCRSEEILDSSHPMTLISLVAKFITCFLQKEKESNIGKICVYKLTRLSIDFTNEYPSENTYEEEDLASNETYTARVKSKTNYVIINEGNIIKQWENLCDYEKEKEAVLGSYNSYCH